MGTLLQNKTLKMFKLLVVAVLAVAVSALTKQELDTEWDIYKTQHNKKYARGEEVIRRGIWEYHLGYIQKHNLEADRGVHTFWLGMNEYGDMSNEEFVKTKWLPYAKHLTKPWIRLLTTIPYRRFTR